MIITAPPHRVSERVVVGHPARAVHHSPNLPGTAAAPTESRPSPFTRPCCVNGTSLRVKVCMGHQLLGREVALEPPMKQKGRLTGGGRGLTLRC